MASSESRGSCVSNGIKCSKPGSHVSQSVENSKETARDDEVDVEKNAHRRWSLEHGFFVVIGGMMVSVEEKHDWILERGHTLTLLRIQI